jgi:hypothetical protein
MPKYWAASVGGVATAKRCDIAPPRSYGQRIELVESTSPEGLSCHFTDEAGNIYSPHISNESPFSCCDGVAAPRATAWAPRSSTSEAHRAVPRATAWAPRSSNCGAQRIAPGLRPWHRGQVPARRRGHRPGYHDQVICEAQRAAPRETAWASRSSDCVALWASAWAPRSST